LEVDVATWLIDNITWLIAGVVVLLIGIKLVVARLFQRLAAESEAAAEAE
jgi:heme/copper-type cytochrome/quinol oxidase subunit 2